MTTLAKLATLTGAQLHGDGALPVSGVLVPGTKVAESDKIAMAFSSEASAALGQSGATLALVAEGAVLPDSIKGALICKRPRVAFAQVLQFFEPKPHCPPGVHPSAVVDPSAVIGEGAAIGPLSVIGPGARIGARAQLLSQVTIGAEASIGEDCLLYPGVRIGERVVLGARCRIQSNAVIGGDGFSYVTPTLSSVETFKPRAWQVPPEARNHELLRIPSLGTVVLEDEVDIGANATIDRATMGATRIGRCAKIDNLVQVAHNVRIGSNVMMAGQSGVAGSSSLGDRVVVGGQAGIGDHRKVGDDAIVVAGAGVINDVPAEEIHGGAPAVRMDKLWDMTFNSYRVGRMLRQLLDLERRLTEMERRAAATAAGSRGQQGSKA